MDDKNISFNHKKQKNTNEKLTKREYIELLRNYNNFMIKKKSSDNTKNQINGKDSNHMTKIIQINRSIKPSNSALDIKEKKEKIEFPNREILNSKTPEKIIIVNKANHLNIKNILKPNNSSQIINKNEIRDYLSKKIEKTKYIKKEKKNEKEDMSTLTSSPFSTPVKNEDEKGENILNKTKRNSLIKYQKNIIGKASITPERSTIMYNEKKLKQKEALSTSVDSKHTDHYQKKYQTLNIEDLIMIEDKFNNILKNVNNKNFNVVSKICNEWWNFYFNSSLKGNCEYLFNNRQIKYLICCHNSLFLISIMIVYDLSFKDVFFYKSLDLVKNILILNEQNFLYICQYLLSRITKEYLKIKWVEQLKIILKKRINESNTNIFSQIEKNICTISKLITILISTLNIYQQILHPKIIEIFNNYTSISSEIINKIFMTNILHIDNKSGSLLFSNLRTSTPKTNNNYIIKNPPKKPLTLVLDLDETLMSFVYTREKMGQGISRIRPFLYNFLNLVKEYYEIIIFTASTQIYADPILDAIEGIKGQYFNYRLYRNHCCIVDNDFVKDISLLGRNLSKTIIVDNMQQNFKLQKENGILITSFWGEDINDRALLQLGRILATIGREMRDINYKCDIRDMILKYKDDIVKNVSMSQF